MQAVPRFLMVATMALAAGALGCGGGGGSPAVDGGEADGGGGDDDPDAAVADAAVADAEPADAEVCDAELTTIYLNRTGGTYRRSALNDSSANTIAFITDELVAQPWEVDDAIW